MADNPFDQLDGQAPMTGNPFDALDSADDSAIRESVESDPSLKQIMSQFARSRLTDMADMAKNVPNLDSIGTMDERSRARFVGQELKAAQDGLDEVSKAHDETMRNRDAGNLAISLDAKTEAERRLARAQALDDDRRAGIKRTLSPQELTALNRAVDEQERKVAYYEDLVTKGSADPSFIPADQDVATWRENLKRERQTLNKLVVGREQGSQVPALEDPSFAGELGRGLKTGLGTAAEMFGSGLRQLGDSAKDPLLTDVGGILKEYGRGVRRDTPAQAAPEILKLGEKNAFATDLKNYLGAKLGEGFGTSIPIIAGFLAAGLPAAGGGSVLMGVGQMRSALEESFAEEGVAFDNDKAATYVYLYGSAIGALEGMTEAWGLMSLTGEAKKQAARSLARALAAGVAKGATMEGITEGLQEIVEIHGVNQVTGKPIDWPEARRRMLEATAAGAVPGSAFGGVTAAGERKTAFDVALAKAKELGFGEQPTTEPAADAAQPAQEAATAPATEPATTAPETTEPAPAAMPEAAAGDLPPQAAAVLDAVDSILPDGLQIDRETVQQTIAAVQGSVAEPVAAVETQPAAPAVDPQEAIKTYLDEGGSLSKAALADLAKRAGVAAAELPAQLDKAVEAGLLRKTAGGMYRRGTAAPVAEPQVMQVAQRRADVISAIDEALALGQKIAPKGTKIATFSEEMRASGNLVDALSDARTGDIKLATYAMAPKGRMAHEAVHTLVTRGHLAPDEVVLLAERAEAVGVFDSARRQMYREAYRERYSPAYVERILDEEAAAHLVEARINGADYGSRLNGIIDKLIQALERIANALNGKGYQTADDVVTAITSGEIAQRDPVREWMRAEDVTAFAMRENDKATRPEPRGALPYAEATGASSVLADTVRDKQIEADAVKAYNSYVYRDGSKPDAVTSFDEINLAEPLAVREAVEVLASSYGHDFKMTVAETLSSYGKLRFSGADDDVSVNIRVADHANQSGRDIVHMNIAPGSNDVRDFADLLRTAKVQVDEDGNSFVAASWRDGVFENGKASTAYFDYRISYDGIEKIGRSVNPTKADSPNLMFAMRDGLDMSPEARKQRAEEMGFDTSRVFFHGTNKDFDAFDKKQFGSSTKASGASQAAWFVDDPRTASGYADYAAGGDVRELMAKADTYERLAQKDKSPNSKWWDKQDEALRQAEELEAGGASGQSIIPVFTKGNFLEQDFRGAEYTDVAKDITRLLLEARADGYDGVRLLNLADDVALNGRPATHVAIFDPKNIRSVNAAFDPAAADSPNLMFAFAGERAKTADLDALAKAKEMETSGQDRTAIWNATGWFRGVDGKWRFEIDDSGGLLSTWRKSGPLKRILKHKQLSDAYPAVGNIKTTVDDSLYGAAFTPAGGGYGSKSAFQRWWAPAKIEYASWMSTELKALAILHEAQHAISQVEGFARGSSQNEFRYPMSEINAAEKPLYNHATAAVEQTAKAMMERDGVFPPQFDDFPSVAEHSKARAHYKVKTVPEYERKALDYLNRLAYERSAGEVEAINVQRRATMTAEERKMFPPWTTQHVPDEMQYIQYYGDRSPVPSPMVRAEQPGAAADVPAMQGRIDAPTIDHEPLFAMRSEPEVRQAMKASAARGVELPGGVKLQGIPLYAIRAYHGSPHDFDRFSMEHIGKGEGAQAYGHGLYFAENEGVAKSYREQLTRNAGLGYSGAGRTHVFSVDGAEIPVAKKGVADIAHMMRTYDIDPRTADGADWLEREVGARGMPYETIAEATALARKNIERKTVDGRLYEVKINADPEQFLDWNRRHSEHPPEMRAKLENIPEYQKARESYAQQFHGDSDMYGWGMIDQNTRSPKPDISNALREAGIPGIRYLDQGSRGAGEGSRNYVVFDDALIEIVAKDGKPVTRQERDLFAMRFPWSRPDPLAGINTIVRDLAYDLGITVRQGLKTKAAKDAKRAAKQSGVDLTSYFDPMTGVLRVRSMSDLGAVLSAAGEAVIRKFDSTDLYTAGPGRSLNPLETVLARHAAGLLGQSGRAALWASNPTFSGSELMPTEREALAAYIVARHNQMLAATVTDQATRTRAERALYQSRQTIARIGTRKLDAAVASLPVFDPVPLGLEDVKAWVDVRHNPASLVAAPVLGLPDPADQREAFGQWFKSYMLDPASAERQDRNLFQAFEDVLDKNDPVLMAKIDGARDAIAAYAKAAPVGIMQSMISSPARVTSTARMWREIDRDGFLPTMADRVRQFYTATWDKAHPFYRAVRSLLELTQVNTGERRDILALDNAYKLLRLAPSSHAWAGRDLEDGIRARNATRGSGPSLVGALKAALGDDRAAALETGPDSKYSKFTAYLIARRAVKLWDRFEAGTLERPPVGASRDIALKTIQVLETEQPQFMAAAEQVYQFQRNLLTLQRDAGLLTDDLYAQLMADEDYVPFLRDMTDQKSVGGRALGGATSIIKRFRGSERNILDPVAMIAQKVYETRHLIAINDAKVALLKLAESAGPGGGMIAERLDAQQAKAMRVDLRDGLRSLAREMGVDNSDAIALVQLAQQLLGDELSANVFTREQIKAGAQPITWAYENGIPVPIRLADGDLGRMMFETLEAFGESHKNLLIDMMAVPTQLLRSTITSNPAFILRNMWVDGLMAYMYERTATPWLTQVAGFKNAVRGNDEVMEYAANAGLMGGAATNAFEKLRLDRDVESLVAKGYQPKLWESPAAWLKELARHPLRTIVETSEASETGTRARLYTIAKNRAKAHGLNDVEAAYEAGFFAHDYIDYSRSGSKTQPIVRIVAFFNAAMQGLDRYYRMLAAKGDFGSAWAPYLDYRLGQSKLGGMAAAPKLVGRAAVTAFTGGEIVTEAEAPTLTKREREELAQSAHAWFVSVGVMGSMSLLITALFGDDERLKEIPEELRATHWVIPLDGLLHLIPKELPGLREAVKGQMLRLPKAFETAWMANLVERIMLEAKQGNPRWFENYVRDLKNTMQPPLEAQALQLFYELRTGTSMFTGRDIVPTWKAERLRESQWDEYTSEFAKWLGKKADLSPYYIDHTLKGLGSSWARDMLSLNVPGLPWYKDNKPEKSLDDYVIARRFLWKAGKGADSAQKVREIMGAEDPVEPIFKRLSAPYSKLDASAATYKDYIKRRDPASASDLLDRLSPAERGFAVMGANLEGDSSKYKMVHPMHRADKILREVSSLQKEILADLVEAKKKPGKLGEIIPLDPSQKAAARDILIQYQMMEAHNALVLTGETGWANRAYFDTAPLVAEMRAAVPTVADEFERRLKKANILPFENVKQTWPRLKETIEAPEFAALSKAGEKREIAGRIRSLYGETR